jgi:hypothetical protein
MHVRSLPVVTSRYWAAILVASMCGVNAGDFLSHNLHLGHWRGLAPLAAVSLLIVWAERWARIATEAYYWLAIIVLRTTATNPPRHSKLSDTATAIWALKASRSVDVILGGGNREHKRDEASKEECFLRLRGNSNE